METSNNSIIPSIRNWVEDLNLFVNESAVNEQMMELVQSLLPKISLENPYAVADLKISFPENIGSIRVAVFYPGVETKVERHPNSRQLLYSLQGTGETRKGYRLLKQADRYLEVSAQYGRKFKKHSA